MPRSMSCILQLLRLVALTLFFFTGKCWVSAHQGSHSLNHLDHHHHRAVQSSSSWTCGTHAYQQDEFASVEIEIDNYRSKSFDHERVRQLQGKHEIQVRFHMFTPRGSTEGVMTTEVLQVQIDHLNDSFRDFSFVIIEERVHESTRYFNSVIETRLEYTSGILTTYPEEPEVLHIFTGLETTSRTLGVASFPWQYAIYPARDSISVVLETFRGSGGEYNEGNVFVHEVGHWLGLLHTFEGGCEGGDGVADTPNHASPTDLCGSPDLDTCPLQEGLDPIRNVMNYVSDSCLEEITPGQEERMRIAWEIYRDPATRGSKFVNDFCPGAIEISEGEVLDGDLYGAIVDVETIQNIEGCDRVRVTGPGLWYKTVARRTQTMLVSICNSVLNAPMYLTVHEGNCNALNCIGDVNEIHDDGACNTLSWNARAGVEYKLHVMPSRFVTGTFQLFFPEPATNDLCDNAVPIQSIPSLIEGTLAWSTRDEEFDGCTGSSPIGPGVWYEIVGTGSIIEVRTCNGSPGDYIISVFSDCNPSMGSCVATNDERTSFTSCSTVNWLSELGRTYKILVRSVSELSLDDFQLDVKEILAPVENGICEGAIDIAVGESVLGDTRDGLRDYHIDNCFVQYTSPGLWFQVVGNGREMTATTCYDGDTKPLNNELVDTKLSVLSGACQESRQTCLGENDDFVGLASCSLVKWQSTTDEIYFILITGWSNLQGRFLLSVFDDSVSDTSFPTVSPSQIPSIFPTSMPTLQKLSVAPSQSPSVPPSSPSLWPTDIVTTSPSVSPSGFPSDTETVVPSNSPSQWTTLMPSHIPSIHPTETSSLDPSTGPSAEPTILPSTLPTSSPSRLPLGTPSSEPTVQPTPSPSISTTGVPTTSEPTTPPTFKPSLDPAGSVPVTTDSPVSIDPTTASTSLEPTPSLTESPVVAFGDVTRQGVSSGTLTQQCWTVALLGMIAGFFWM